MSGRLEGESLYHFVKLPIRPYGYHAVYDPGLHRVQWIFLDAERWEALRIRESHNEFDGAGAILCCIMYFALGPTLLEHFFTGTDVQRVFPFSLPSTPSDALRIYLEFALLSFGFFCCRLLGTERLSLYEELRHGLQRLAYVSLAWPVYVLWWPLGETAIGWCQQLQLEAAWRRKHKVYRLLTDQERQLIEQLWAGGHNDALVELLGPQPSLLLITTTTIAFGTVALFWSVAGGFRLPLNDNVVVVGSATVSFSVSHIHTSLEARAGPLDHQTSFANNHAVVSAPADSIDSGREVLPEIPLTIHVGQSIAPPDQPPRYSRSPVRCLAVVNERGSTCSPEEHSDGIAYRSTGSTTCLPVRLGARRWTSSAA